VNLAYLDSLPEVANRFKVDLEDGEKVVFTASLVVCDTEKRYALGIIGNEFTLTNKHIVIYTAYGLFTVDIKEDTADCVANKSKIKRLFNLDYFSINLNKEMIFDNGKRKLKGFRILFNKRIDMTRFEKIMRNLY